MRRSAIILAMVLVGAAVPWAASAQDCKYYSFKIDIESFAFLDEPIAPYDLCWEFSKTVGALNGRYVACVFLPPEFVSSDDIWGDGWHQLEAWKFYSLVETKAGNVEIREWTWFDNDFGNETGMAKVIGGTGAFEGAFGTLSFKPGFPNRSGLFPVEGFICTP